MALTERQTNDLRCLDLEYGNGLFDSLSKLDATEAPVLIIGLGGLGCKTVNNIKRTVIRKMRPNNTIYYLAIDSADNDLDNVRKSKKKGGVLEDGEAISLFDATVVAAAVFPENVMRWKNPNMYLKIDGSGCGGRRQNGRYLITHPNVMGKVSNKIETVIKDIRSTHEKALVALGKRITIIFVAGISGGTGSGTFIDMAYLVDHICKDNIHISRGTNYKINGYIYLPDVQHGQADYLERNGYAALKELDYFMNLDKNKGFYEWPFSGTPERIRDNIYDFCTIVGGTSAHGAISENRAVETATQMIVSTISNASFEAGGKSVQLLESFYDNQQAHLGVWFNNGGSDTNIFPRSCNYSYCVVGYGCAAVPVDEIMSYMASKMFDGVLALWNNIDKVNSETVNSCLDAANVYSVRSILNLIKSQAGLKVVFNPEDKILKPNNRELLNEINVAISNADNAISNIRGKFDVVEASVCDIIIQ